VRRRRSARPRTNLCPLHFRAFSSVQSPLGQSSLPVTFPIPPFAASSPNPSKLDGVGSGGGAGDRGGGAFAGILGVGVQLGGRRAVRAAAGPRGPPGRAPELGPHARQPLHLVPCHLQPRRPRHPLVSSPALSLRGSPHPWILLDFLDP
jgi:hypothetical protein